MTTAEAKGLERSKVQEAMPGRETEFEAREAEIDRTIPRRSGAWNQARAELAIARIDASIEDRLTARKAMIERCPALATPHELRQFEQQISKIVENGYQAVLKNFPIMGVHPPASILAAMPTRKQALQQKIHNAARIMQLEALAPPPAASQFHPGGPFVTSSGPFRFQVALSFPGEHRGRVRKIAEALAASLTQQGVLYDEWHRAEFARPNLDVYLPALYHEQSLLLVFFLCGAYARKEWCGLEWRAGRDLLKQKQDDRLMLLRLDHADVPGVLSIDGYLDISDMPDHQVAVEILKRLAMAEASQSGQRSGLPAIKAPTALPDPPEYWQQRKQVADTAIMKKIWSRPRWSIWIRPAEFRSARLQNLEQCKRFVQNNCVRSHSICTYPWLPANSFETGDEWIAAEVDMPGTQISYIERWAFFRSGQFVHNRAFDEVPLLRDRFHILEILDTVTGAFEFAARMAGRGILTSDVAISFDLSGVDGRSVTWPQDGLGDNDAVGPDCWCQHDNIVITRLVSAAALEGQPRELALDASFEIYSKFGWADPPRDYLADQQNRRFGPPRKGQ